MIATSVSHYKLQNCFKTLHGNKGITNISDRLSSAIVWLETFFSAVCEKMPTNNELYLPYYLQWADILAELNIYMQSLNHKAISQSYLSLLHTKFFNHIKNPKYTRQGKCDICLELKQSRMDATTEELRQSIQGSLIEHNEQQMAERSLYK